MMLFLDVCCTAVTTYSLVGIAATWGALGRGHWFLRQAAVLLFVAAWLFAADDRLALLFLAQSAVVVLRLSYLRMRQAGGDAPQRPHFSVADLLLATVLIAGMLAIVARLRAGGILHWLQDILPGVVLGCFTLVAVWVARSPRSVWLRLPVLLVVPSVLMGLWLWAANKSRGPWSRVATALALLAIAALPARLYYRETQAALGAYAPPLADNGYADLLQAAELVGASSADVEKLSDDETRGYIRRMRPALELVERGLARPCQAILPGDMTDNSAQAECKRLERLCKVLVADGKLLAEDGNMPAAAKRFEQAIEVGTATARHGVWCHDMFSAVFEELGVKGFQTIIDRLSDSECRELGERLAALDAGREPLASVAGRERLYLKKAYPWKYRFYPMAGVENDQNYPLWEGISSLKRARLRLLVCHLALRRAWLADRQFPDRLEALVPRYLDQVPPDPYGDGPFVYRKLPDGYRLYSVGFDLHDDGGQAIPPSGSPLADGDVVVDPIPVTTSPAK